MCKASDSLHLGGCISVTTMLVPWVSVVTDSHRAKQTEDSRIGTGEHTLQPLQTCCSREVSTNQKNTEIWLWGRIVPFLSIINRHKTAL